MSTHTPALLISGLQKSYGNLEVLKGVDLTLTSGGIQGLVGLNGSGKTTTLECILGLQRFDQGEVSVLGLVPTDLCTAQGKVTAVFDSPSLNPNLTVRQCLQHSSLLSKQSRRHPKELEKLLGLSQFSNFPIKTLSLGNKRRASIAHALISEPDLVIMDEPFNGLDAGGVDEGPAADQVAQSRTRHQLPAVQPSASLSGRYLQSPGNSSRGEDHSKRRKICTAALRNQQGQASHQ